MQPTYEQVYILCVSVRRALKVQPLKRNFKKTKGFLEVIILNVLRDLLFSRNEPLKLEKG